MFTSPGAAGQRDRRALDRHATPGMPRPHADHRTAPPRGRAARVRRPLQHAPPAQITRSAPARRQHSPAPRSDRSAATTRSPRRPGTRDSAGRMRCTCSRTPSARDEIVYVSAHADRLTSAKTPTDLAAATLVLSEATWGDDDYTRRRLRQAVQSVGGALRAAVEVENVETALEVA